MQYMQYVRSLSGSVTKTWNSINPATLSGAIDVVVVEQEDGTLACSPFHVRFGKLQLLRPSDKKVTFYVNGVEQKDIAMKLGEGGEAFFVFETTAKVPMSLQTSPVVSPATSPILGPVRQTGTGSQLAEPDSLDLDQTAGRPESPVGSDDGQLTGLADTIESRHRFDTTIAATASPDEAKEKSDAMTRAIGLSTRLWAAKIASRVTESGDLMLDMTGYKDSGDDSKQAERLARQILEEVLDSNHDLGDLLAADEQGNVWIYSSTAARDAAQRPKGHLPALEPISDVASEIGYTSDEPRSDTETGQAGSEGADGSSSPTVAATVPTQKSYAKTLRLSSDQLKALHLSRGQNRVGFTVGKAVCEASIYYWRWDVPIVISDIDGTITKSDALGHVLNMIGRDWTHQGVAKLYTDIVANGYHILYLTSRSVGQADTTRTYLQGVVQDGYRLPAGPVILSPDRTMAALRREVYLRKPEVFKMACLRDIMNLFLKSAGGPSGISSVGSSGLSEGVGRWTPFYAGFGNRLTDALSYRSVNIPSTRIFTINSNAEVSLDLLSLNPFKTGYVTIREIVDQYFPPVSQLVISGAERFTDFNYWRQPTLGLDDFTASESSDGGGDEGGDDEGDDEDEEGEEEDEDEEEEDDDEEDEDDDDDDDNPVSQTEDPEPEMARLATSLDEVGMSN